MKPLRSLALIALVATLGACGLKGGLEKPPPQFGEARRQYDAEQKAKADAAAEKAKAAQQRQTVVIPSPSSPNQPPIEPPPPQQ